MAGIKVKKFTDSDDIRRPDKMVVEFLDFGGAGKVAKMTMQPGWTWDSCVKPIAGTDTCQAHHLGVVAQGTISATHEDGTYEEFSVGDAYEILPGHTGTVVGAEVAVAYEFSPEAAENYAK